MVYEAVLCPQCGQGESVYRHGTTRDGTSRYRCVACCRCFQAAYINRAYLPGCAEQIEAMALNGSGIRDTARVLQISAQTVMRKLKKKIECINEQPPVNPNYCAGHTPDLKLYADEMWSYVGAKKQQRWLWWVEDAASGEVVAFVFGRRTNDTFQRLLQALKQADLQAVKWITDAWAAYTTCLPAEEHQIDKPQLQRLERKHLTLRTRVKRLTRKTICFSKLLFFHDGIISLFIHHFFFKSVVASG